MSTLSALADAELYTHTIAGRPEGSEASFAVINPATDTAFARCPDASREQLDRAVAAAREAFPAWAARSADDRREALRAFADRLRAEADAIAPVLTREQGKPLAAARTEVMVAARHIEGLSSVPLADDLLKDDGKERVELTFRPHGVVGAIAPWNVPVMLGLHKVAQALYTGNTIVLKPSPYTPLSTLMWGRLTQDVLPAGVVNVLAGGNDLGRWITDHPGVDMISFTGSTATGQHVLASAARTMKRVTLELGGNDPAVVLEDADLDLAAPAIFRAAFNNAGQVCMAVKRVYVADRLHDALCERLADQARAFRVGEGFEDGVEMGPLQNRMQFDKVRGLLDDALGRAGAKVLAGGHTLNRPGYFISPTVISGLEDDAPLVAEEQFGPVLPVLRFGEAADAVRRANAGPFGLGASVWTRDLERGARLAAELEAGTVWINRHGLNDTTVPFGGAKESGFGREQGALGLRAYMEPKVISYAH
jgi:acyl-CoA reductase-like NAD-dependent aldehyde dehydrogenase